ncbi:MAG: sigma-B regulation protein RsbQ [Frankiales bacterium]|jgi:sigma-B regulation protein RsbQ|nr:sigma-B regulation protein RsbQ [Frankiales bacterium]
MVFAHGFGCDQRMWRHVAPRFADRFRVLTFDNMGAGGADPAGYDPARHDSLDGYAEDVVQLCRELGVQDGVFVGHSVSSMIGALASLKAPGMFSRLVMVSPSARFVDEGDYVGGFTEADIADLLESLDSNYLGWSGSMAPAIMGNPDRPELGEELAASFCRTDPAVARQFARVTFLADNRADLRAVTVPTLVLQCSDDAIAPVVVGEYVRDALPDSTYVLLEATGHCPNLSAPEATVAAIESFLAGTSDPSL